MSDQLAADQLDGAVPLRTLSTAETNVPVSLSESITSSRLTALRKPYKVEVDFLRKGK